MEIELRPKKNKSNPKISDFMKNLTLIFIVLKLCDIIDWSWWLIISPIWGSLIIIFISLCIEKWRGE